MMKTTQGRTRVYPYPPVPSESEEQIRLASWLTKNEVLFFHCPNGGSRDMREAVRLKAQGVRPGVPDICIPLPRGGYHGLWIELKRVSGGVLSAHQLSWLHVLSYQGYLALTAKGADEAIRLVQEYLLLSPTQVVQQGEMA